MKRLLLTALLLPLTGCVHTASYEVGVVEEYTRPPERPIPRPRSTEEMRALEAEWPPATAWEPPPADELRIRPVSQRACAQPRPLPPPEVGRRRRRVFDAAGTDAVILRVRRTGRDSPPIIRLRPLED